MPWFVVSDDADSHPKFVRATNAPLGLWVRAGAYASRHLTDGLVPGDIAKMYGSRPQIAKLVAAGLWHEHGHTCSHPKCAQPAPGDFYIHDYLDYNPTRSKVTEQRERAAEKKRNYRERQSGQQQRSRGERPAPAEDTPPPRRPSRPASGPIPEDWQPTDEDVQAAQLARADAGRLQLTPQQLDAVTRKFVHRMRDEGKTAAAWGGRWQQWAETERVETSPAGDVIPFGRRAPQQQTDDLFGAAMQRAQARMNEGGR